MNIDDLDKVNKLVKTRDRISRACKEIEDFLEKNVKKDSGGIEGVLEYGYNFSLSEYSDGSGMIADLTGCYVARESCEALLQILQKKNLEIDGELLRLGVDTV